METRDKEMLGGCCVSYVWSKGRGGRGAGGWGRGSRRVVVGHVGRRGIATSRKICRVDVGGWVGGGG